MLNRCLSLQEYKKQFTETSAQIDTLQNELSVSRKQVDDLNTRLESFKDMEKNLTDVSEQKQELQQTVEHLKADLAAAQEELNTCRISLQEANFCKDAYEDILSDRTDLELKLSRLTTELQNSRLKVSKLLEDNAALKQRTSELENGLHCRLANSSLERDAQESAAEPGSCLENAVVEETARKSSDVSHQLSELQLTLEKTEKQYNDLNAEKTAIKEECERIFKNYERSEIECSRLKENVSELAKNVNEGKSAIEKLQREVEELKSAGEKNRSEFTETETNLRSVIDEKERVAAGLKDDLDAMSGSVQRREHMWETAREKMEQEIESLRFELTKMSTESENKIKVNVSILVIFN